MLIAIIIMSFIIISITVTVISTIEAQYVPQSTRIIVTIAFIFAVTAIVVSATVMIMQAYQPGYV